MEILWFLKGTKKISKDKSRKSGHQKPGLEINMAFTEMIYLNCFLRNVEKNFWKVRIQIFEAREKISEAKYSEAVLSL